MRPSEKKDYPISEIFGPTIQGEGPSAGQRTFFVRFAGCDFDCLWCDTKYAVNPKYPGWQKTMMSALEIYTRLRSLGAERGDLITLSGGNPALFVDVSLLSVLSIEAGFRIGIETQGSKIIEPSVLKMIDVLVVSPKPPSSGMSQAPTVELAEMISTHASQTDVRTALKYVSFDDNDLAWIEKFDREVRHQVYDRSILWEVSAITGSKIRSFLSVGTVQEGHSDHVVREQICDSYRQMCETVSKASGFAHFTVLPQLHVLAWGMKRGV